MVPALVVSCSCPVISRRGAGGRGAVRLESEREGSRWALTWVSSNAPQRGLGCSRWTRLSLFSRLVCFLVGSDPFFPHWFLPLVQPREAFSG